MSSLFSLEQKVIAVTGGTGMLGAGFLDAITLAGGTVAIIGRNEKVGESRAEAIRNKGGNAIFLEADVTSVEQMKAVKDAILAQFGRLDGLVNAAGGNIPEAVLQPGNDIFSLDIAAQQKAVDLNCWGTIIPTQVLGELIAAHKGGSIVNISSVSAKKALTRVLGYGMGKTAIDAYTRWMAVELANRYGDAIRVNSITPGFFLTEQNRALLTNPDQSLTDRGNTIIRQTPFKRFGDASELGGALVFLLSDASSFMTGTDIVVDGGFLAFSGV